MVTETSAGGLTEPPWGGQGTIILILYLSQIQGSHSLPKDCELPSRPSSPKQSGLVQTRGTVLPSSL